MKILLTSQNKAKNKAIHKVASQFFETYHIESISVETGVSATPINDEEGIQGALNRIKNARQINNSADIYVGLEGILTENSYGSFICGWAVLESNNGKRAFGASAKVKLPNSIAKNIHTFKELSNEVSNYYNSDLIKDIPELGSNGIITNRAYTRIDEFEDALMCAFGYFMNNANYEAYCLN
ncbi:MAG: DUF84 family protein [Candidatus Magasanikbacteria bacterium]|jgi:inosine/xanthosine triphosphatase|nr:DUF84 family protein [Candidatus Magasanikbacteria bacterium]MBT4071303.1 DUF84 family protein [Candidatus Magasanikbacteria bacterium]